MANGVVRRALSQADIADPGEGHGLICPVADLVAQGQRALEVVRGLRAAVLPQADNPEVEQREIPGLVRRH
jgi:hypothetical protein